MKYKFNNLYYNEDGYLFESEVLLKSINHREQIDFVEIPTIYNNSKSHINKIFDTYNFIKLIITNIKLYASNR